MKNFVHKFDFMHQYDDYSCGRVCAYMVTANLGGKVSRRWLRYLLNTDMYRGTPQKNLVTALRSFGYSCNVMSHGALRDIKNYLQRGYLAIACVDDNMHWIVVRGFGKGRVYVADPWPLNPKYHTLEKFNERIKHGSVIFVRRNEK